jgi:hypothetical protein
MMSAEREIKSEVSIFQGALTALERRFIIEFLQEKGYKMEDIAKLPKEDAKKLMKEACQHASLKLADMESKARFIEEIRGPSP